MITLREPQPFNGLMRAAESIIDFSGGLPMRPWQRALSMGMVVSIHAETSVETVNDKPQTVGKEWLNVVRGGDKIVITRTYCSVSLPSLDVEATSLAFATMVVLFRDQIIEEIMDSP